MIVVTWILVVSGLGVVSQAVLLWLGIRSLAADSRRPLRMIAWSNVISAAVRICAFGLNVAMCALLLPVLDHLTLTGTLGYVLMVVLCVGPFAFMVNGLAQLWLRYRLLGEIDRLTPATGENVVAMP